ncbi:hypothetical protein CZ787_10420 [Halomonas citrativorans]|uniref:Uncharacterized protein n=1 Tax=Halomonas citrativorans TaxID=2742612 RepID=A0A1R4I126_9GAMM|nr:hypothetical protein CZ787_10420 [Halomonas citrativorans]
MQRFPVLITYSAAYQYGSQQRPAHPLGRGVEAVKESVRELMAE